MLAFLMERDGPRWTPNVSHFRETSEAIFLEVGRTMRTRHAAARRRPFALPVRDRDLPARPGVVPGRVLAPTGVARVAHGAVLRSTGRHLATVEVRSFGSPSPLTVEALHELPFECRWATAFHGLDPDARRQEILEVRKRWATKQKGVGAILTEIVTRNPFAGRATRRPSAPSSSSTRCRASWPRPFALAHMNVHVWDEARDAPTSGRQSGAA